MLPYFLPPPRSAGLPGPLRPTWRRLYSVIAPLLHPDGLDVPLRASVLLHGPGGSGKRTAARAACAAAGMHLIPLSCHEIKVRPAVLRLGLHKCCDHCHVQQALPCGSHAPYLSLHTLAYKGVVSFFSRLAHFLEDLSGSERISQPI